MPAKDCASIQCLLCIACAEVVDWCKAPAIDISAPSERGHIDVVFAHAGEAAQQGRLDLPTVQALVRLTGAALKVRRSKQIMPPAARCCIGAAGPEVWQPWGESSPRIQAESGEGILN
jgi:hypothetical protein